jgi:hypothetical protein
VDLDAGTQHNAKKHRISKHLCTKTMDICILMVNGHSICSAHRHYFSMSVNMGVDHNAYDQKYTLSRQIIKTCDNLFLLCTHER